uniref:Uncharacterized protein n=1 Tax=Anguilla anguilla TaxID=7936 RepID=A0A0E9WZ76_ANGAN
MMSCPVGLIAFPTFKRGYGGDERLRIHFHTALTISHSRYSGKWELLLRNSLHTVFI